MTVYYNRTDDDPAVWVTSDGLRVGDDLYEMGSISGVEVTRPRPAGMLIGLVFATPVGMLAVAILAGVPVLLAGVIAILALGAAAVVAATWHRPRRHELWIEFRGRPALVYDSTEEWRVCQLGRALHRAVQTARMHDHERVDWVTGT